MVMLKEKWFSQKYRNKTEYYQLLEIL